jgi:DNA repair protein RadA/Sms
MATKAKKQYVCNDCGSSSTKWSGQCGDCGAWNTFTEVAVASKPLRHKGFSGSVSAQIISLGDVHAESTQRLLTGVSELDRVLGGGLVPGSVVLIGGDPGIGKSTLLLQTTASLAKSHSTLYVTGEESLAQVGLRADRLGLRSAPINLLAETQVETIIALAQQHKPNVMVIDSIQTIFTEQLSSAPGCVGQVRESAQLLVQFAKATGVALYLVGHVNKDGAIAGPRVLEHMVDTVLYFEGQKDSRFRILRAVKNRFGAVNEMGIFGMTDKGLKGVTHPSAIFLSRQEPTPGTTVTATWEGSRPMLLEVQALVADSMLDNPRRVSVGIDPNRLALLLAVMTRHGGIIMGQMDVFLNVVGGVKIMETGADLAIIAAVISSFKNRIVDSQTLIFGEVGLGGEIRPVQGGQERINEAAKHGFKRAIVPKANATSKNNDIEVCIVNTLQEALQYF